MAYMTCIPVTCNMAAFNKSDESKSSDPFQPYSAIHEDDFQSRYRNRYYYNFDQNLEEEKKGKKHCRNEQ